MLTVLRSDLKAALKARDRVAITVLRSLVAAIENAEAVPGGDVPAEASDHVAGAAIGVGAAEAERRSLTQADQRAIVEDEYTQRLTSADEYERLGHTEPAERLRAEAAVLGRYL